MRRLSYAVTLAVRAYLKAKVKPTLASVARKHGVALSALRRALREQGVAPGKAGRPFKR